MGHGSHEAMHCSRALANRLNSSQIDHNSNRIVASMAIPELSLINVIARGQALSLGPNWPFAIRGRSGRCSRPSVQHSPRRVPPGEARPERVLAGWHWLCQCLGVPGWAQSTGRAGATQINLQIVQGYLAPVSAPEWAVGVLLSRARFSAQANDICSTPRSVTQARDASWLVVSG